ncbi:hypothetical protein ID866_10925 [Astraeus odoratus]|nr:hypothetical protein ID866_10925 [Astraeus odoratus]
MSTAAICQASPLQVERAKAKAQAEHTAEDWELVLEASLNPNSEDDEVMASLQKKAKEGHMKERTAERRWKCEEAEQRIHVEAEQREGEVAEQKRKEEEEAWRAEEAKKEAEEAEKAAEAQRRAADRQCKPSMVIPAGGSTLVHLWGPGLLVTGVWSKAAGGAMQKQRRMEAKEDDEDNDDEGDFTVLLALTQEHRDALGALTTTLSALLKEFKGYHHKQWDLQAHQVKGLKALQREMKKANALKVRELKATTKVKEKAAEVPEESSESGDEEEQIKGKGSEGREVVKGEDADADVEMGAAPSASVM